MSEKYSGMTVNERLYLSGLLTKFDKAVEKKDLQKVIQILKNVELTDNSIESILEKLELK